jgi:hypothetical protein
MKSTLFKCLTEYRQCFGGSASTPPTPAPAPQQAQGNVQATMELAKQRQRAAASNTILTGGQGVTMMPQLSGKSLLGS